MLRVAVVFVLKSSRFYARLLPAIAAEMENGADEELERVARAGRVGCGVLGKHRRLLRSSSRPGFQPLTPTSRQRTAGVGLQKEWHDSWTLARL